MEGGGLGVVDGDQVATKHSYDPAGLLNPGKLGGFCFFVFLPGPDFTFSEVLLEKSPFRPIMRPD